MISAAIEVILYLTTLTSLIATLLVWAAVLGVA